MRKKTKTFLQRKITPPAPGHVLTVIMPRRTVQKATKVHAQPVTPVAGSATGSAATVGSLARHSGYGMPGELGVDRLAAFIEECHFGNPDPFSENELAALNWGLDLETAFSDANVSLRAVQSKYPSISLEIKYLESRFLTYLKASGLVAATPQEVVAYRSDPMRYPHTKKRDITMIEKVNEHSFITHAVYRGSGPIMTREFADTCTMRRQPGSDCFLIVMKPSEHRLQPVSRNSVRGELEEVVIVTPCGKPGRWKFSCE